jgi:hypothetical protein
MAKRGKGPGERRKTGKVTVTMEKGQGTRRHEDAGRKKTRRLRDAETRRNGGLKEV